MASTAQQPSDQHESSGKMSWRKFKQIIDDKQRELDAQKGSEQPPQRMSLLDRQRALIDSQKQQNTRPQNQSQNNNQADVAIDAGKKKRNMRDLVQLHLEQSKAFGKNKTGGNTRQSQSPTRNTSTIRTAPVKLNADQQQPPQDDKNTQGTQPRTTAAVQDIPVIWYTKEPRGKSPGKSTSKPPVEQNDPRKGPSNRPQQRTEPNEKTNKKQWNTLVRNHNSTVGKNSQSRPDYLESSPHRDSSPEMPPKGGHHANKRNATKTKNKNIENQRKKLIRRISNRKPKQTDWKNAETRTTKPRRKSNDDDNGMSDMYAFEPKPPMVVDRHDMHHHEPRSHRESNHKGSRSKSPHKHVDSRHEKRSRSESPQKRATQRNERRSRSQSPEKRLHELVQPTRKPRQTTTMERTIPKVVRVIDERGEQHVIVEKKERIEMFKGRYPNYLRTGEQPNLKKWTRLKRAQMQNTARISEPDIGYARPHPPVWFDRSAYHNDQYETALQKRKLVLMGIADDEFMETHGEAPSETYPVVNVHQPKTGAFYRQTPEPSQQAYNRGRVSSLSNFNETPPPKPRRSFQNSQENLLPPDEGVEVRYNEGYEIYRNKYPNYLRQKQWKKSVPMRIQHTADPDSEEEYPQYQQEQEDAPQYNSPSPPLPPLQEDEDTDSEEEGFRHRRDLGSTSPKRDMLLNIKRPKSDAHDSGIGSDNKMTPPQVRSPAGKSATPRVKTATHRLDQQHSRQHTELIEDEDEPDEVPQEIPEVLQNLLSSQQAAFITEAPGLPSDGHSVQSDAAIKFGRSPSELDHVTWQRYSISTHEGVAAVVRCPRSRLHETKESLVFEDSIPPDIHGRLPALPYMEFEDWDGNVRMSPMRLYWENPQKKGRPMQHPIYLALPIHGSFYNEILQQLIVLYTPDLKKWHQVEGKVINLTIEGEKHDFVEVFVEKPFRFLIFDVKVRYREDVKTIMPSGGDLDSHMENGIRVEVRSRTFDKPAKLKLKVEPLDLNETDLRQLVPSIHAVHAVAVSPIVKLATSEPMKQAVSIYVPKPGHSTFGSVKMGFRGKLGDLRNTRVHLLTKDKEVQRFNASATLKRELAKELEFQVRIWKYGGRCYCLLVLEGVELGPGTSEYGLVCPPPTEAGAGFLSDVLMKQMALEMTYDDVQLRALGRLLLNTTTAATIIDAHTQNIEMAMFKILRRWKNQTRKTSESILIRRLATALRESGLKEEAGIIRQKYDAHMTGSERNTILAILDELKACPSVLVNWKLLAKYLGLSPDEMSTEDLKVETPADIRRTCSRMLKRVFEKLERSTEYYRDILMAYIQALEQIGCHKIAASIEKRHIDKFYVSPI